MKKTAKDFPEIKGWGKDADPKNDPTYPIKQRTDEEQKGYNWERPTQQPIDIEVLHSIERPNVTAVFGTSVPPSGLSGAIRRMAFKYSEGSFGHWLPLLLADRINVIEGIFSDIFQGHIPNYFSEKGWNATWKYNRKEANKKIVTGMLVVMAISSLIVLKNELESEKAKKKKKKYIMWRF